MRPLPFTALLIGAMVAAPEAHAAEAGLPAWNYLGGANDDEGWGELSPAYAKCTLGNSQSPVAISEAKISATLPMAFSYKESDIVEQWRDLTLVLQFEDGNTMRHEGMDYRLRQIRFHTPSEHEVQGKTLPVEIHFVHQHDDKVLIVAVQATMGEANPALQTLIDHLPEKGTPEKRLRFDPSGLLPSKGGFYAYSGSLTWPPCTEGVDWKVMKTPITLSQAQFKSIARLLGRNARLLQPIYFRTISQTRE